MSLNILLQYNTTNKYELPFSTGSFPTGAQTEGKIIIKQHGPLINQQKRIFQLNENCAGLRKRVSPHFQHFYRNRRDTQGIWSHNQMDTF